MKRTILAAGLAALACAGMMVTSGCFSYALGRYGAAQLDSERAASLKVSPTPDGRGAVVTANAGDILSGILGGGSSWLDGWLSAPGGWQATSIGMDATTILGGAYWLYRQHTSGSSDDGRTHETAPQPSARSYVDANGKTVSVITYPDGHYDVVAGRVQYVTDTPPEAAP
jgi:hypothetical protein